MKTTCPHCSVHIDIDPETHAALQGQTHFQCPGCKSLVPVPRIIAASPQASSPAPATIIAQTHRGLNRNLLILGSAALLVLGGLGFFLASRGGSIFNTEQKITNEIIKNTYFQNLIASGKTTMRDLEAVAIIRPYQDGYIGISKEQLAWPQAQDLARRTGAHVLELDEGHAVSKQQLVDWLASSFKSQLSAAAWIQEAGKARVLAGSEILVAKELDRQRNVFLHWLPAKETQGTVSWQLVTNTSPPEFRGARVVNDSNRNVIVLFGGEHRGFWSDQTWEFDGAKWVQIRTPMSPPGRIWHGLAYDSSRAKIILFGGQNDLLGGSLGDTWEYDGRNWTKLTPVQNPEAMKGCGMVYDPFRNRVVLFGGGDRPTTWEFYAGNWHQVNTQVCPSRTGLTSMVFDARRRRAVLFGGTHDETWEYDGTWTKVNPGHKPSSRWAHAMCYVPSTGKTLLFGGYDPVVGSTVGDTWEYDGSDWTETSPRSSPSPREQHVMAFESHSGTLWLLGNGETWHYQQVNAQNVPKLPPR